MDQPEVVKGKWIVIGPQHNDLIRKIHGYVLDIYSNYVEIGYYQGNLKAIRTEVVWNGSHWQFMVPPPHGTYLRGQVEYIVKQGP